jgi:hypothetical protein
MSSASVLTFLPTGDCPQLFHWVSVLYYDRRPVGQSVLKYEHPSEAYDRIFITVRHLRVCWYGVLSLTRGRVCRLQLLLALASAVIFGSESLGAFDHILLCHVRDFPCRHLPRLTGLRLHTGCPSVAPQHVLLMTSLHGPYRTHRSTLLYPLLHSRLLECPYDHFSAIA